MQIAHCSFGVAPDHPEVKNVINTFTKTAEHPRLRYFGNLSLGSDVSLQELRDRYHAVLLTYGADQDRQLELENEQQGNVISARKFVAWYNGLPGAENLAPDLSGHDVTTGEAQEQATEEGQEVQLKEKMRRRGGEDVPNVVLSGPETFHLVNQYNRPVND